MPQPHTLYFDRSTGRALPDALKILRLPVEHQSDHFKHDTEDDIWLAAIGEKGWYVFTHDKKFHYMPAEKSAVKQFDIGCFVLWGAQATRWEKMLCFAKGYRNIIKVIISKKKPFIYRIDKNGKANQVKFT